MVYFFVTFILMFVLFWVFIGFAIRAGLDAKFADFDALIWENRYDRRELAEMSDEDFLACVDAKNCVSENEIDQLFEHE